MRLGSNADKTCKCLFERNLFGRSFLICGVFGGSLICSLFVNDTLFYLDFFFDGYTVKSSLDDVLHIIRKRDIKQCVVQESSLADGIQIVFSDESNLFQAGAFFERIVFNDLNGFGKDNLFDGLVPGESLCSDHPDPIRDGDFFIFSVVMNQGIILDLEDGSLFLNRFLYGRFFFLRSFFLGFFRDRFFSLGFLGFGFLGFRLLNRGFFSFGFFVDRFLDNGFFDHRVFVSRLIICRFFIHNRCFVRRCFNYFFRNHDILFLGENAGRNAQEGHRQRQKKAN